MFNLKELKNLLSKREISKDIPKHVIINLFPIKDEEPKTHFKKIPELINTIMEIQVEKKIPIITISIGKNEDMHDQKVLHKYMDDFLKLAISKKAKVTVLGKWYDLTGEIVEGFKRIMKETRDFDNYFLNLCINYDGKTEITDASRVIIKKISLEKENTESITTDLIKENIYSSYFLPADLIIEPYNRFTGTFLWDSVNAKIVFLKKQNFNFQKADFEKAISSYSE